MAPMAFSVGAISSTGVRGRRGAHWDGVRFVSTWSKAMVAIVLLALLFEGKVVYLTAYSVLLLYISLRRALRHAVARLELRRALDRERLFPGEIAEVTLEVSNPTPVPLPWVLVQEGVDRELALHGQRYAFATSLGGRSGQSIRYRIQAHRRGVYRLGPVLVNTGDPLGFDEVQLRVDQRAEVLVYPRLYPLDALGLGGGATTGLVRNPRRHLEDPTRVAGIREHTPGESIRHVHWRATAHTGSLKVKSFETTQHVDVAVVLDLFRDRYPSWGFETLPELAIEIAASLLAEAAHMRQGFGLFAIGRPGELGGASPVTRGAVAGGPGTSGPATSGLLVSGMGKGEAHLARILEMLARIGLSDRPLALGEALDRAAARTGQSAIVFAVTPQIDAAARHALLRLVKGGRRAMVVEITDDPESPPLPRGIGHARVGYCGDVVQSMARRNPVAAAKREPIA